jgi:ribonucleotide reductase alpha subunit
LEAPRQNELSRRVWEARYRYAPRTDAVPERSLAETWDRVAGALASVEPMHSAAWQRAFRKALDDFKFLPAGRILAGAGAALQPLVDGSISDTLNVPADTPRGAIVGVFERAYALGAKGCTVFRPNAATGSVLNGHRIVLSTMSDTSCG